MNESLESKSYSLFGVRVDVAQPHHAALAIFEGAVAHVGIRVVLADLWTFLLAQRDMTVWESLSGADLVLPVGDDAVIRRLTRRRGVPTVESDELIQDLLIALEKEQKSLVLMAPEAELSAIGLLLHRLWPTLRVTEFGLQSPEHTPQAGANERLLHEVNQLQPEVLLIGGQSPWQERWTFEQRETLLAGAVVLLPSLHATFAAIGQRAGIRASGPQWQRRRAVVRRAFDATIAPAAHASVRTLSTLLRAPSETLRQTALARWRFTPVNLRRTGVARGADARGVRVSQWHDRADSMANLPVVSPLARLGPPRISKPPLPALPQPSGEVDVAEQPTISLTLSALRAAIPPDVTGHFVDAPDLSASRQNHVNGAHSTGISQELIATGKIRDPHAPDTPEAPSAPDAPSEPEASHEDVSSTNGRGTTPLPHSDGLSAPSESTPAQFAPTTLLREPLAPTTKLRLPLAPTTKLPRRAEALRGTDTPDADEVTSSGSASATERPLEEAAVAAATQSVSQAGEDTAATRELEAVPPPPVEELATAASLGNTPRRVVRRRRRMPPRRRKRYYRERG